jgi:hypothetical protein
MIECGLPHIAADIHFLTVVEKNFGLPGVIGNRFPAYNRRDTENLFSAVFVRVFRVGPRVLKSMPTRLLPGLQDERMQLAQKAVHIHCGYWYSAFSGSNIFRHLNNVWLSPIH